MDERDREERIVVEETPRVERETTVISTGEGRGGGGTLVAVVLLLAVVVLAFLYFSGTLGGAADETNLNVNIDAPDVDIPDVDVPVVPGNSS